MLIQFEDYLTFENIYLWINFGVLPFWFTLIIIPNSRITQLFVNSIVLPLILATAYVYVIYQAILLDEPVFDVFKLYLVFHILHSFSDVCLCQLYGSIGSIFMVSTKGILL